MNDYRAISLPTQFRHGLELLVRRVLLCDPTRDVNTLGDEKLVEAVQVVQVLFGLEPVFGQLRQCSINEVREACQRVGVKLIAELAPRIFIELLQIIEPTTAVCALCGELPLNNVGGKLQLLDAGHACPFCGQSQVRLVPITLRQLAWTDGRLVDPGTDYDLRVNPGQRYPLQDELIIAWAGDVHPELLEILAECRVSVYALLAYLNLQRRMFTTLEDAARFICDSHSFGVTNRNQVQQLAREARAFVIEREITNSPTPRLAHVLDRDLIEVARVVIGQQTYLIDGQIGQGDKCIVYRGYREARCSERVIIKVLSAFEDQDLLQREARMLQYLQRSQVQGSDFFRHLVPEFVAFGEFLGIDGLQRPALVYRHKHQFDWTLADVQNEYSTGVDARTAVWLWNRLLLLLAWLQLDNLTHGAILPGHVLLHARDHGVMLLDWSSAIHRGRLGSDIIPAISTEYEAFYPPEVLAGQPPTVLTDIAMSARCIIAVAGGNLHTGQLPMDFPTGLGDLLRCQARFDDRDASGLIPQALELERRFRQEAERVFGPPRYHEFHLPRQK